MANIAVDQLEPGMVLSEDVLDINTRLLLSRGQKIVSKHIRVLKIWGVNEVNIVGTVKHKACELPVEDPEKRQQAQQAVDAVFKHLDLNHKIIREIYQSSVAYRLGGAYTPSPMPIHLKIPAQAMPGRPKDIGGFIRKIDEKLPEAPVIVQELNDVIADELSTSNDVARVVNKSPSLSAVLLKLVNSAFYGFPSKIDRISRAVTIIGTKQISGIALGICVMNAFKDIPREFLDVRDFTRHSLACGIVARILAALKNIKDTEQLFVSGLLHDIGKLIVFKYYPDHAREAIHSARSSDRCLYQAEREILGLNHTQIGRHLIRKWRLPDELEANIVHHHTPSKSPDPTKAGIIQLADLLVHGTGIGNSGELTIPCFDYSVLDGIGISACAIPALIRQATLQLAPLKTVFEG
ncbi:HDOD domain-containing protein [Desulfatitalea tepidiphila]|uniref:HDOD domain-containing protein n=1 Tax=Desulfatitalea tepidiphila TaxID=1185843 RepID=UPI0006B68210|nr:HDOD domain-containing protein [Desulfatitalea tepidiphila]